MKTAPERGLFFLSGISRTPHSDASKPQVDASEDASENPHQYWTDARTQVNIENIP